MEGGNKMTTDEMITELRSFAYSGFLKPTSGDLLKYADELERLLENIKSLDQIKFKLSEKIDRLMSGN